LVSFHSSPQTETSLSLRSLSGVSARPLSGQGSCDPNNDCFPQWPRIAHRPASCFSVVGPLLAARAVPSSHGAHIDAFITSVWVDVHGELVVVRYGVWRVGDQDQGRTHARDIPWPAAIASRPGIVIAELPTPAISATAGARHRAVCR
jgi:hypothetical protein